MSHHIYTTPGFITHSAPYGEAGKFFLIFTRDLGMVGATAQGVRLSQSKLRYYTQDFSCGLFSVVKGKEVWRVTGAKEIGEGVEIMDGNNKKSYVQVLLLLKRLLPGEEKNEKLFAVVEKFHSYLSSSNLEKEKRELVEYLTVFRILNSLGYIHAKSTMEFLCESCDIDDGVLEKSKSQRDQIIREINEGLKESQL